MKIQITLALLVLSIFSFGQTTTFEDWKKESETNKRLLPKYGMIEKSKEEKEFDKEFINNIMMEFDTKLSASNHMVDLGFKYLYRGDLKTAMSRFNQAYLLDNKNSNIYWGYGAIYMAFGQYEESRNQYTTGLEIDSNNDNILIDYGTTYLGEFYNYIQTDSKKAHSKLEDAIEKLTSAYQANPKNPNASYKLSICYLNKKNCQEAKRFLGISDRLGNGNITESYRNELSQKCASQTNNCSSVKVGSFKTVDDWSGETLITRTKKYQIEENKEHGYKLKLKVTWIDDCTYQLKPIKDLLNSSSSELPKMILTCKIIEIIEDGYIQVSTTNSDPTEIVTKVIVL
ncbi:tetratricopeptide (TPR) repeat protein [Saonia flava]|uniref:Tetratricopeptide (TPR) repeat protein n=1 Tax=Saonia flava TaxID=523696 RepID=A0A846QY64_9FLAO|nr:tetratricopeptide repeat protein [Saonia flava]NJB71163.1 tetratricopeptide (TPR) repeat protein [Saonia flava]